jgi:hypothetical protein
MGYLSDGPVIGTVGILGPTCEKSELFGEDVLPLGAITGTFPFPLLMEGYRQVFRYVSRSLDSLDCGRMSLSVSSTRQEALFHTSEKVGGDHAKAVVTTLTNVLGTCFYLAFEESMQGDMFPVSPGIYAGTEREDWDQGVSRKLNGSPSTSPLDTNMAQLRFHSR